MSDDKLMEQVLAEREFLHDISTPLMVAMGNLDQVIRKYLNDDPKLALDRLNKATEALQRITERLSDRRSVLHTMSQDR